ncbi:hypothetical protein LTR37_014954 [Vermiconidia calcicola]|uniref:Uncharacterized protein n=1 Tax=Vermiconidia calcicola TaxID=1690605 RepID=A0ACC3MS26_9PEZI|nr:hypothetical protein LTR37_014954 [Vermiconidia calcicola]
MSRYKVPVSGIGRLSIAETAPSPTSGMPVATRASTRRTRDQIGRQASSGAAQTPVTTTAGPSRSGASPTARRSGRQQPKQRAAATTVPEDDDDDDDNDDDDDESESSDSAEEDEGQSFADKKLQTLTEIFSTYTDGYLTPSEFRELSGGGNGRDNNVLPSDRRLRYLASLAISAITNNAALSTYRGAAPQDICIERLVERMGLRLTRIFAALSENIQQSTRGSNVPETIDACRKLFNAIGGLLTEYRGKLTADQQRRLGTILFHVLKTICQQDSDLYASSSAARPAYASESTSMTPYRRFLSRQGKPVAFIEVLGRLPDALLRERSQELYELITQIQGDEPGSPVFNALWGVYVRAIGAQAQ